MSGKELTSIGSINDRAEVARSLREIAKFIESDVEPLALVFGVLTKEGEQPSWWDGNQRILIDDVKVGDGHPFLDWMMNELRLHWRIHKDGYTFRQE